MNIINTLVKKCHKQQAKVTSYRFQGVLENVLQRISVETFVKFNDQLINNYINIFLTRGKGRF